MGRILRTGAVLTVGTALVLLLPYSYVGHEIALVISGLVAATTITVGMRRYKPDNPVIWGGFLVIALLFTTSFTLRTLFPDAVGPRPEGNPHITDYIDMAAFVLAILVMHRVGRLRDDSSDPTTVIDSVILAGGTSTIVWLVKLVPLLEDHSLAESGRRWAFAMTVLALGLAFCMVRIILTSSQKTLASRRLGFASVFCVAAEGSTLSPSADISNVLMTFGIVALWFLTAAAAHPSMVALSAHPTRSRDLQRFGRITVWRIVLMTLAILIAPAALLMQVLGGGVQPLVASCLIVSWFVVTGFVMLRINGLMRVREQITAAERTLTSAASSFVAAADLHDTYDAALKAMRELAGGGGTALALIALRDSDGWRPVHALGVGASDALDADLDPERMALALEGDLVALSRLAAQLAPFAAVDPDTMVLVAPLFAQHQAGGVLMLFSEQPQNSLVASSLLSLAGSVALAVEAAVLSEDLHQRRSERQFRSLVENSPDLILVVGPDLSTSFASPSVERLLASSAVADFNALLQLMPVVDRPAVLGLVQTLWAGRPHRPVGVASTAPQSIEFRIDAGGDTSWFEATIRDLTHDEQVQGVVFNARDVTERKLLEEDLRHKVLHDSLTGIANRVLFRDRLDHALSQRRTAEGPLVAVLFIDLDDFKTVNDGLGHDVGDELLKILALRLESYTRKGDTAARLGGDEFAVLFEGFRTIEDVMTSANGLLSVLMEPVDFGERHLEVSASVGIAVATDESATSEILLRNADVAMYHSKQTGKNRAKLFDQSMYVSAFERLELKNELAHALGRGELSLDYQPIFRLADGAVIGFEALMRWRHPHLGQVAPGSFIPLTEESGLIKPMGAWALREACEQVARWRGAFGSDVFVAVNLSPRQLEDDAILDHVRTAVEAVGLPASALMLELTESAGLDDTASQQRLLALREFGCRIAADDFGTGFASYAALQQLPFTTVKIDRSLIAGLADGDQRAVEQVRSIIQMGHGLGLTVTAEGIETDEQRRALVDLQADHGQGFGLGRPAPHETAGEHLAGSVRVTDEGISPHPSFARTG